MIVSSAKTAELIEMPFEMLTLVDPRNYVLDGVQILRGRSTFEGG